MPFINAEQVMERLEQNGLLPLIMSGEIKFPKFQIVYKKDEPGEFYDELEVENRIFWAQKDFTHEQDDSRCIARTELPTEDINHIGDDLSRFKRATGRIYRERLDKAESAEEKERAINDEEYLRSQGLID